MMFGLKTAFIVITLYASLISITCNNVDIKETKPNVFVDSGTELIHEEDPLLFISTLDGTFIGVNHRTGKIIWKFKEEAAVKVPIENRDALMPLFLPDPRDGSLYLLNSENQSDLKKLQFTIQQLVSTSPCRSTDGIFYTGKKVDNWFMVDWRTGVKEELSNVDNPEKVCPVVNRNAMFLGRTEYNLIIHDITRKERKWNVTYYDYAAKIMPQEILKNHDYRYFSGSSTGKFAVTTNDLGGGLLQWEIEFNSPVIGVYMRDGDGLISVPFTTMDDSSMNLLTSKEKRIPIFHFLYIGEHTHGMYALPAVSTTGSEILLLDGPSSNTAPLVMAKEDTNTAILGYYNMPENKVVRLQIAGRSDAIIEMNRTEFTRNTSTVPQTLKTIAVQTEGDNEIKFDRYIFYQLLNCGLDYISSQENIGMKAFMAAMIIVIVCMFVYFRAQMRELKQSSSSGSSSRNSVLNSMNGTITALAEELPDGSIKVGKIIFNSENLLGKGCEGTFVFRGQFDNRNVAVKRLLPECFTVADREVCLLRESDQHPNVIRYFCMEQDKMFRYIALELCAATLQDYTEKGVLNDCISPTEILAQATAGLEHLHSLNIVHRDIKPHNVLLSIPSNQGKKVRAMISDFGLCKKLQTGRGSFSRKSGITGTDGWIAPEMIHGRCRTTTAVDVFSLGCVFYYVLSKGKHPFGDSFRRQANIMGGEFRLNELIDDRCKLWTHIISKMVTLDPTERPDISAIRKHPAFWSKEQILTFLQDVSDRIEKEDTTSTVLIELEKGNSAVLKGDWRTAIEPEIAEDLTKYRSYRADSLRDLLRALRNKKHHYRELSTTVREILGNIPDQFVCYWTDRFPQLVLHTWIAMQCVKKEDVFKKYYHNSYKFPRTDDNVFIPLWIQQSINASPRRRYSSKSDFVKFFLPSGISSSSELNWRHRPNAPANEVEKSAEDALINDNHPVLQDENINGSAMKSEENVDIEISLGAGDDVGEKWQKTKLRNRGRYRSKKKTLSVVSAVD